MVCSRPRHALYAPLVLAPLFLFYVAACGDEKTNELAWRVRFTCESDRAVSDHVRLRIRAGGCQGAVVYESVSSRGLPPAPGGAVGPGVYGFEASALQAEQVLALSCREAILPSSEALELTLASDPCMAGLYGLLPGDQAPDPAGPDSPTGEAQAQDAAVRDGSSTRAGSAEDASAQDGSDQLALQDGAAPGQQAPDASAPDSMTANGPTANGDAGLAPPAADDAGSVSCGDCSDSNPCTDDRCELGACVHAAYAGARECDGIACTQGDQCVAGQCQAGTPIAAACVDDGDPCTQEQCVPGNGCIRLAPEATCGNPPPAVPASCTLLQNGGHDYLVCSEALSWTAARERCRAWGGGLAIIGDGNENAFLAANLGAADRWIGANDRGSNGSFGGGFGGGFGCGGGEDEGNWYWASASTSSEHETRLCSWDNRGSCEPVAGAYLNWASRQPDNWQCVCSFMGCSDGEDCATMLAADGGWNDTDCGIPFGYVCESP